MSIKIAVISDLHVGDSARGEDFRVFNKKEAVDEKYILKFKNFVASQNIEADYLVITGDITNKANYREFSLASILICEISKILGVKKKNIFYVPGNHDRNWTLIQASDGAEQLEAIKNSYLPLMYKTNIFQKNLPKPTMNYHEPPYLLRWETNDIIVYGINTAAHDGPEEKIHYGLVAPETIQKLKEELPALREEPKLKLFLAHHHPIQYKDPIPNRPDFSQMQRAAELLSILDQSKFDIMAHGHKHNPNLTPHIFDSGHRLMILAAGSFSSIIPHEWQGAITNQFHLLEIDKARCSVKNNVKGILKSWTYLTAHGWVESEKKHHGIEHELGFGKFGHYRELYSEIVDLINAVIDKKNYCSWQDILRLGENYKYVSHSMVREALQEYCDQGDFTLSDINDLTKMKIFKKSI